MTGEQHKRMGTAAGIALFTYGLLSHESPANAIALAATPIGAMLPDYDSATSKLGRTGRKVTQLVKVGVVVAIGYSIFASYKEGGTIVAAFTTLFFGVLAFLVFLVNKNKFVRRQMGFITKHRGILHTFLPPVLIYGSIVWNGHNEYYLYGVRALAIGCIVHLIGDLCTVDGAPILWPLAKFNIRLLRLESKKDKQKLESLSWILSVLIVTLPIVIHFL